VQADEIRHAERPSIFSPEQLDRIVFYIKDAYNRRSPVTVTALVELHIQVAPNTLHHILANDDRITTRTALPMEDTRMAVTIDQIRE
jgi:hypothetical protein